MATKFSIMRCQKDTVNEANTIELQAVTVDFVSRSGIHTLGTYPPPNRPRRIRSKCARSLLKTTDSHFRRKRSYQANYLKKKVSTVGRIVL